MHYRYSPANLTRNLRARELGCHTPNPSVAPFFKTFRTRPNDEYGFWNVNAMGDPVAVPPFTARFSTKACNGHALLIGDEDGILTVLDTRRSLRDQMRVVTPSHAPPARFRAHDNAVFDATWICDDTRIASASGDATVRVFDPETFFRTALCRGASQSVKCVRMLNRECSDSILVSSGRDGAIRLHDLRVPSVYDPSVCREMFHKPVFEILRAHAPPLTVGPSPSKRRRVAAPQPFASVTSVSTIPFRPHCMFSSGAADGSVKLWDIRAGGGVSTTTSTSLSSRCGGASSSSNSNRKVDMHCIESVTPSEEPRVETGTGRRRRHGIASLDIDSSGTKLLASSTDSTIYVYDAAQLGLGHSQVLTGHTATSFYVRASFSPCGRFVSSGSADSMGYIWDLEAGNCRSGHGVMMTKNRKSNSWGGAENSGKPIVKLDGHHGGDVSALEWCKTDMLKVATCGDDTTVKVWRAQCGLSNEEREEEEKEWERRRERGECRNGGSKEENFSKEEGYGVSHAMYEADEEDGEDTRCDDYCNDNISSGMIGMGMKRLRDTDIRSFFGDKCNHSTRVSREKRNKKSTNANTTNSSNSNSTTTMNTNSNNTSNNNNNNNTVPTT